MNYRIVARTLGTMLIILAFCMIPSIIVGMYYRDIKSVDAFSAAFILMVIIALILRNVEKKTGSVHIREGYLIVVGTWIIACICCALPYVFSGTIPNFFDALFESTSGVTTTGASILTDIESLPKAMLFWRGFTHWMGGLGILTMAIAVLPALGISGFQMAKAEASYSEISKSMPKMADTAKLLYKTYFILTAICIVLLMIGGLGFFDASTHAFSAIATGGFSPKNASVSAFNSLYVEIVLAVFMVIGSISFILLFTAFQKRKPQLILKNQEVRFFLALLGCGIIVITLMLCAEGSYGSFIESFRHSFFQSISVMTTTGFYSKDYALWPAHVVLLLLALSICGGCSGSTTGGVKSIRILISLKITITEYKKKFHPRAVYPVKINGSVVSNENCVTACNYIFLFFVFVIIGGIILSVDPGADLLTGFTASLSSMTNLGPGIAKVGPTGSYAFFGSFSKVVMSCQMIIGKLEIFAVLILFSRSFWNPDNSR